jgi:hypothetical protein
LEVSHDDAMLPVNIHHDGSYTNDLLILVSPLKIESGNFGYKEAKAKLKEIFEKNEDYRTLVKERYGNWTQFPTDLLNKVIEEYGEKPCSCEDPDCVSCNRDNDITEKEEDNDDFDEDDDEVIDEYNTPINSSKSLSKVQKDIEKNKCKSIEKKETSVDIAIKTLNEGFNQILNGLTLLNNSANCVNTVKDVTEEDLKQMIRNFR